MDLYFLDADGAVVASSQNTAVDSEPAAPPWTVTGLSINTVYFVEVRACDGTGSPEGYELEVYGY